MKNLVNYCLAAPNYIDVMELPSMEKIPRRNYSLMSGNQQKQKRRDMAKDRKRKPKYKRHP